MSMHLHLGSIWGFFAFFWMNASNKSQVFLNTFDSDRSLQIKIIPDCYLPRFCIEAKLITSTKKCHPFLFHQQNYAQKKQRPQFPAAFWGGKTPQQNGPEITSFLVSWGWVSASPTQIQVPWVQQRLSTNWFWCWIEPWLIHQKNWGWHWHFVVKDRWFWDPVW